MLNIYTLGNRENLNNRKFLSGNKLRNKEKQGNTSVNFEELELKLSSLSGRSRCFEAIY